MLTAMKGSTDMNAKVNGKSVLFSESILFYKEDQVQFGGAFPLKIVTTDNIPAGLEIRWDGASFVLSINGMTPQIHDRVATGEGQFQGAGFKWMARAQRVAETTPVLYGIEFTAVAK